MGRVRAALRAGCLSTLLVCAAAGAAEDTDCFAEREPGSPLAAVEGDTVRLEDGTFVRLADLLIPASVERAAAAHIEDALAGGAELRPLAGHPTDRYGALLGDLVIEDTERSLRHRLLAAGLALIDPVAMSKSCLGEGFEAEREAERQGRGLWRDPPVRRAREPNLSRHAGQYVLVEGTVVSVGRTRRTLYLNFGRDYATDFTALADRRAAKAWEDALSDLTGSRVRVRGVLEEWNGGLIRIEHPAQVETRSDVSR